MGQVLDIRRTMNYHNERAVIVTAERLPENMPQMHAKIDRIEEELRKGELLDLPVKHYFSHGVYAREMFIPKGTIVTGKIHKYQNLNIMSKGELSVLTEAGVVRIRAPFTVVSPPGTRRVAYAHADTIWITIHGTEEQDLERIEDHFIAQTLEDYQAFSCLLEEKRSLP